MPAILSSPYALGGPNAGIRVFTGKVSLTDGKSTVTAPGRMTTVWLPSPRVEFHVDALALMGLGPEPLELRVRGGTEHGSAYVTRVGTTATGHETLGFVQSPVERGLGKNLSKVRFHIANFPDYRGVTVTGRRSSVRARVQIEAGDWVIRLDAREGLHGLATELRKTGGYLVTHVGDIARLDGADFDVEEARPVLDALGNLLSFSSGGRTSPFLSIGYDRNDHAVWRTWEAPVVTTWAARVGWFNAGDPTCLDRVFAGLLPKWTDPHQHEVLRRTIYLHSEANRRGIEPALIIAQAALEVLAWQILVLEKATISRAAFDVLPAADMLRLLLTVSEIPLAIPSELRNLVSFAKARSAADGPQALTLIRNSWVHPPKKSFVRGGYEVGDAWYLAQWYVELALLRWLGYEGTYVSRVKHQVESVPWA
jgi:hypothetical protein